MATIDRSKMVQTDSKGKVIRDAKKELDTSVINFQWWKSDEDELAQQVASTIKFIQSHQNSRLEQLTADSRLYGKSGNMGLFGTSGTRAKTSTNSASDRISFNLCASVIDTLVAKIAKNKVIPTFATQGAIWGMQKKAEQLSKFVEGCFYGTDMHIKGTEAFRDGGVWGSGLVHIFRDGDEIGVERVVPHELYVDTIESLVSKPRQLHRVKIVDRGALKEAFKEDEEKVEAINNAMPASYQDIGSMASAADLVKVTESWHLPSGKDADDGLHVLCIDDKTLVREEWDKDYFPFPQFNYSTPLFGHWGQGACERLQSLQGEINRLMILDQRSRWMMSSFKILVKIGSKVVSQHLNNEIGTIVYYTDTPPQYVLPPAIDPSNGQKIQELIQMGYRQEGVSELQAASVKPMGVDSGKAMRTMADIADDRQLFVSQQMERFYLECARQMIEVAKDIYKDKGTFKAVFPSGKFMETIDWKDIKLKEDEYVLKAFPTSSLADDMTGRLQDVQDLAQAGMISPRTARKLLRMPDLEMADNLANAAEDLLCNMIEKIIDGEEFEGPLPFMDFQLGKQLVLQYMNYAKLQNAPDDVMGALEKFNNQLDDALALLAPPPPPMAAPGGAPPANPAPTPESSLIPNVNSAGVAA